MSLADFDLLTVSLSIVLNCSNSTCSCEKFSNQVIEVLISPSLHHSIENSSKLAGWRNGSAWPS